MSEQQNQKKAPGLLPLLSPLGAWALAFGCAVGWGSFVMPGTTFLPIAGPLGTVMGLVLGALVMLIIAMNYHYLMNQYPDPGGAFAYSRACFGHDHGFLCAWFLILTYVAIVWANATALPIVARNLLGETFQFGFNYEIAGFRIYLGEILISCIALLLGGLICIWGRIAYRVQVVLALLLAGGIALVFAAVVWTHPEGLSNLGSSDMGPGQTMLGALNIVALAPWAFVGFESLSHSSQEFRFPRRRSFRVLALSVLVAGAAYALLAMMAAMVQPEGYSGWFSYISAIGSFSGLEGLPTFFAAHSAMGHAGLVVLGIAALGGVLTGIVGNTIASSRLLYSMSRDGMLPEWFGKLNRHCVPGNAIAFIMCISFVIPFFGRTAIGWIVDVTTIGAAVAYAYTSACALKVAHKEQNTMMTAFGAAGLVVSALIVLYFLVPNMISVAKLSPESYFILAAWSILGFAFFHHIFQRDTKHRLGRSTVVWIVLLGLILFTSLVWLRQASSASVEATAQEMRQNHLHAAQHLHPETSEQDVQEADSTIEAGTEKIRDTLIFNSTVQMTLIVVALFYIFRIYTIMQTRERQMEVEKVLAEESSRAKTSFLSNMSHEIRTPMNAIIGLDNLALKDPTLSPRTREQLEKIGSSAKHLLGLINDILDMSRIESGRMVLKNEEFSFRDFLEQINVIINGQCQDKGLIYECKIIGTTDNYYVGDDMKLKQVLINILGNSVKFTPAPGFVTLSVEQTARFEGYATLRFTMEDTGIGMDKDYLPKIFEAFTQEDASTINRYGGSGLGMAITKNIVEMMNGEIQVESEKGKGSTFTVTITMHTSSRSASQEEGFALPPDLTALVVDDDRVSCEHAQMVLNDIGIRSEACYDSLEALEQLKKHLEEGKPYQILLTDCRMPGLDGIALTRALRKLDHNDTAVVMLSGYHYDDVSDEAMAAGVDALMNKPLFTDSVLRELRHILQRKHMDVPDAGAPPQDTSAGNDAGQNNALEGRRVLLAEDVEINADIMIDLLDMEGVSVEHAKNGQIAVDLFRESPVGHYDAVLMDVRMPVMDGLTAAKAIRELNHPDAKTVPIIALTANAYDEDVQRSLQAGMNAHLSKPIEMEHLYDTLTRLIQHPKPGKAMKRGDLSWERF